MQNGPGKLTCISSYTPIRFLLALNRRFLLVSDMSREAQTIGSHLTGQNIHLQPLCKSVKVFRALLPYILNSV